MLRKVTMTALTAFAVLGLAISSASAMPKGPGFGNKGPGMGNGGINKPFPKPINNPQKPGKPGWPPLKPHWPHHHPHWHHVHYRPWVAPVVVGGAAYVASRPVAGPCTCLSKEYTPEGVVVFKDRCTNEMAMNPPPQQTGAVDTQQQTAQYQQQYVQPQPQK